MFRQRLNIKYRTSRLDFANFLANSLSHGHRFGTRTNEVKGIWAAGGAEAPVHGGARWAIHPFLSRVADNPPHLAYIPRAQERVVHRLKVMDDNSGYGGICNCKNTINK